MRGYLLPAVGIPLGIGVAILLRKEVMARFIESWITRFGPLRPPENYLRLNFPFVIKDMDKESARRVADDIKPLSVSPVYAPPSLDFHFKPIVISTRYIQFRWQPPAHRFPLTGKPDKGKVNRMAEAAIKSLYKTKIDRVPAGWKITLVAEIPI